MRYYLIFLFIFVPAIELTLLLWLGGAIGVLSTFAIIIATGIIGANLTKEQGLSILRKIRCSLTQGHIPATDVIDGLIVIVAGAVLLTPGFVTDIFGFILLLPTGRKFFKGWLLRRFARFIKSGYPKASGQG